MSIFHDYPYTNFHDLNLDWILKKMKELDAKLDDFTALNTIKWAGAWNPNIAYEAWSVVKDANNNAYISIKAVPSGVLLSNEEYWTFAFDYSVLYSDFVERLDALETSLQLEINSLDNRIITLSNETASELNSINQDISETQNDMRVLDARMNTFAALPDGSTAGDAELYDIRVGADGNTYDSAGDAVRGQYNKLDQRLNEIVDDTMHMTLGNNICPPNLFNGYLDGSGDLVIVGDWGTTDFIDVEGFEAVTFSARDLSTGTRPTVNMFFLTTYNENKVRIRQVGTSPGVTYQVENGVKYIRFSIHTDLYADYMVNSGTTPILTFWEYDPHYSIRNKKWIEKKWACIGDSLTEANIRATLNYHDYISETTGITVVNMGHSGSGYKRSYEGGGAFYQIAADIPLDSDVVTIFGSGTDLVYISNLGQPTDVFDSSNESNNSICACINHTIDVLTTLIPAVQLGIVAPTPWIGQQPTLNDSNTMGQYVKVLKEICYIRSIPFLDLYHCSNLRPWTAEGRAACYSRDDGNGVHPDEKGHKLIASRFEGFLDFLLLGN